MYALSSYSHCNSKDGPPGADRFMKLYRQIEA